jgi:hypothetical protein
MSTYHNIYENVIGKERQELIIDKDRKDAFILINYLNTVISSFKWKNLPETILPFMPEEQLCFTGRTAFFKDDNGNFKIYPCFMSGSLLENGEYTEYTIIARNGKQWIRKKEDIEICYNNSLRLPSAIQIFALAEDASYALRAVKTSLRRSMIPPVLTATTDEQLKALAEMREPEMSMNMFFIAFKNAVAKGEVDKIDFFDNTKEDIMSKWDIFVRWRNLFYTTFGINNVEIQKKERLTKSEGTSNDEITRYTLFDDMINCRRDWCDRIKTHFGYELDFEINRDTVTVYETSLDNEEKIENASIEIFKGANFGNNLQGEKPTEDIKGDKENG